MLRYKVFSLSLTLLLLTGLAANAGEVLKIMSLGDSNTRGTYIIGPGPHPASMGAGGYRYPLQQMLTKGGYSFDFVGSQTSNPVGSQVTSSSTTWTYDSTFDRDHQGLAGFTNAMLITGGAVPTLTGDPVNYAPSLVNCLSLYKPDIILLMSGTNGLTSSNYVADLTSLNNVISTITTNSPSTHIIVSTIYDRYDSTAMHNATDAYNAGIPGLVTAAQKLGGLVTFVDAGSALTRDDFLNTNGTVIDGIHPAAVNAGKPAAIWYAGIQAIEPVPEPGTMAMIACAASLLCCRKFLLRRFRVNGSRSKRVERLNTKR